MSHISQKQMRQLATNPAAMTRFRMTGELPRTVTPSSPLIDLLEAIPPQIRLQMRGVKLSPKLGYLSGAHFHNAEQLLKWLKPDREMLESQSWPAESQRDKRFRQRLTLEDLKAHCAAWPNESVLRRMRIPR